MLRILLLSFLLAGCAVSNSTYKVEGHITLKDTLIPLSEKIKSGQVQEIELGYSDGGDVDTEYLKDINIPTRVTGKCKSACAAIALHGSSIRVQNQGQICIHIGKTMGKFTIYDMNFYRTVYPGLSDEILHKVFVNFPHSYCLTSMELKTLDKLIDN